MGVLTARVSGGVRVEAADRGHGPVVLIVHPGLDDGSTWRRVSDALAGRFRVLLLRRRRYRLDVDSATVSNSDEAADVVALVEAVGEPVVIVGQSSGAVVALEAVLAAPQAFSAAVLYEPPVVTDWVRDDDAVARARAALASRKPGRAIEIFVSDIVMLPRWQGPLVRAFVGVNPRLRRLAPRQIDDTAAISALGNRLAAYAAISVPVLLVGGQRSPANLAERLDALEHVLPNCQRATLRGQGHAAQQRKPRMLADVIAAFAQHVTPPAKGKEPESCCSSLATWKSTPTAATTTSPPTMTSSEEAGRLPDAWTWRSLPTRSTPPGSTTSSDGNLASISTRGEKLPQLQTPASPSQVAT